MSSIASRWVAAGWLVAAALGWACSSVAQLPAPFPPKKPAPGQPTASGEALPGPFSELVKVVTAGNPKTSSAEVAAAVRGVSLYPERTRTAILTVAMHSASRPALLDELAETRRKPAAEIDRRLTSSQYPEDLQQAAAIVLVDAPETIDRMRQHPQMAAVVGRAYSTPQGRLLIEAVLAAAHEQTRTTQSTSVDRWAEQLSSNPELLKQYLALLAEYAQQASSSQTGEESTASGEVTASTSSGGESSGSESSGGDESSAYDANGYGVTASEKGYAVSDLPSEEVADYALAQGYRYNEVAQALTNQYMYQDNLDDFQSSVGRWWDNHGQSVPADVLAKNQGYFDSLKQLSQFDRQAAEAAGGRSTAQQRLDFLRRNPQQFSQLNRFQKRPATGPFAQPTKPTGGPTKPPTIGSTPGATRPKPSPIAKGSKAPFSDLRKATPTARRPPAARSIQGGPFASLSGGRTPPTRGGGQAFPALSGGRMPPLQVQRAQPALGNQLGRAQAFHGAAWRGGGPRMGGGPGGGPRPGPR